MKHAVTLCTWRDTDDEDVIALEAIIVESDRPCDVSYEIVIGHDLDRDQARLSIRREDALVFAAAGALDSSVAASVRA